METENPSNSEQDSLLTSRWTHRWLVRFLSYPWWPIAVCFLVIVFLWMLIFPQARSFHFLVEAFLVGYCALHTLLFGGVGVGLSTTGRGRVFVVTLALIWAGLVVVMVWNLVAVHACEHPPLIFGSWSILVYFLLWQIIRMIFLRVLMRFAP